MNESKPLTVKACSLCALAMCLVLAGFLEFRILHWIPMFEKVFLDFNTALPTITVWLLSPWFKFVVPGIAVFAILKELLPNKTTTLMLNGVAIVAVLAFQEFYAIALYDPLMLLVRSVSGGL